MRDEADSEKGFRIERGAVSDRVVGLATGMAYVGQSLWLTPLVGCASYRRKIRLVGWLRSTGRPVGGESSKNNKTNDFLNSLDQKY